MELYALFAKDHIVLIVQIERNFKKVKEVNLLSKGYVMHALLVLIITAIILLLKSY